MLKFSFASLALGAALGATLLLPGTSITLVLLLATFGSAMADEASDLFSQGLRDRTKWENWFSTLTGDKQAGAEYWAGQRSASNPGKCVGTRDFAKGCNEAKARLTGPDVLRKSHPDYRAGWNAYVASATPAPVQPPPAAAPPNLVVGGRKASPTAATAVTATSTATPPPMSAGPAPIFSRSPTCQAEENRIHNEMIARIKQFGDDCNAGINCDISNYNLPGKDTSGWTWQRRSPACKDAWTNFVADFKRWYDRATPAERDEAKDRRNYYSGAKCFVWPMDCGDQI